METGNLAGTVMLWEGTVPHCGKVEETGLRAEQVCRLLNSDKQEQAAQEQHLRTEGAHLSKHRIQ